MKLARTTFESRLKRHGFKEIGSGLYSTVFAKEGSDRVIKVGSDRDWEAYILWAMENGYAGSFAPKVYSFHRHHDKDRCSYYVAVVERLRITCGKHNVAVSNGEVEGSRVEAENLLYCDSTRESLFKRFPGLKCFVARAKKDRFSGDWHNGNWMLQQADGKERLVLIDPQSGRVPSGNRRWHAQDFVGHLHKVGRYTV